MDLSERIRAWREWAGESTASVAEAVGLTRQAVNAWERGVSPPSLAHLGALCEFLGITMERFHGQIPKRKRRAS